MTQAQIAAILATHIGGDPASPDRLKRQGLRRVNATVRLDSYMLPFSNISAGQTFPHDLSIDIGGTRTVVAAGTPLAANQVEHVKFNDFVAAITGTSPRQYDQIVDRHRVNHQAFLTDVNGLPRDALGNVNRTMAAICKALGLNLHEPEVWKLLQGSNFNTLTDHDKVAMDKQAFVDKLLDHIVSKAEHMLTKDKDAKFQIYRNNANESIERFFRCIEGQHVLSPEAKQEITRAIKKLGYARSADSIVNSLKDTSPHVEDLIPKEVLRTAINRTRINSERALVAVLEKYGVKMQKELISTHGPVRLGTVIGQAVSITQKNAATAIICEGLDKKRGVTTAFDPQNMDRNDIKLPSEYKKDWKKTEKEEKKTAGKSSYPKVSKPPYRGLIRVMKFMDQLTHAATTGFQKTTLAAAWFKTEKNRDFTAEQAKEPLVWTDVEVQATIDFLNDIPRFEAKAAEDADLAKLRSDYLKAHIVDPVKAEGILKDIAKRIDGIAKDTSADPRIRAAAQGAGITPVSGEMTLVQREATERFIRNLNSFNTVAAAGSDLDKKRIEYFTAKAAGDHATTLGDIEKAKVEYERAEMILKDIAFTARTVKEKGRVLWTDTERMEAHDYLTSSRFDPALIPLRDQYYAMQTIDSKKADSILQQIMDRAGFAIEIPADAKDYLTSTGFDPTLDPLRSQYYALKDVDPAEAEKILKKIAEKGGLATKTPPVGSPGHPPRSQKEWHGWSKGKTPNEKEQAGICRLMMRNGMLERMQVTADWQNYGGTDPLVLQGFSDKCDEITARTREVSAVLKKLATGGIPPANVSAEVQAAINSQGPYGHTPQQLMNEMATSLNTLSRTEDSVDKIKAILGFPLETSIPAHCFSRDNLQRAMAFASAGDVFGFMSELDNQRALVEQKVLEQLAARNM